MEPPQPPNYFGLLYAEGTAPDDLTALEYVAVKPCEEVGDVVVHVLSQGCAEALTRRADALERQDDFRGALLRCRQAVHLQGTDSAVAGPVTRIDPTLFELLLGGSIPANLAGLAWVAVRGDSDRGMLAEAAPQRCADALVARAAELRAKRDRSQADLSAAQRCADMAMDMAGAVGPSARAKVSAQLAAAAIDAVAQTAQTAGRDAEAAAATARSAEAVAVAAAEHTGAATARCGAAESAVSAAEQRCAELTERLQRVEAQLTCVRRRYEAQEMQSSTLVHAISSAGSTKKRMHAELLQLGVVRLRLSGGVNAVLLPETATVWDLKAAAHKKGGPKPWRQELRVGGRLLDVSGSVPLSRSDLIRRVSLRTAADGDGPVVEVTERKPHPAAIVSAGICSAVVLLDDGGLLEWGRRHVRQRPPTANVTAVCAGTYFVAVVAARGLTVWGEEKSADRVRRDLPQLEGREVVCCSATSGRRGWSLDGSLAAVTACGRLVLCGPINDVADVPSDLQGSVAAVAIGSDFVVAVTEDGKACRFGAGGQPSDIDLGGRAAVSVSAGWSHHALVLDDGSVLCGGNGTGGRCKVPSDLRDVVSCSCGWDFTVALRRDGTLSWWGDQRCIPDRRIFEAGSIAAISACSSYAAAVTTDGRLLAAGHECSRECGLFDPPADLIRYRGGGGGGGGDLLG